MIIRRESRRMLTATAFGQTRGPREIAIEAKIAAQFQPVHFEIQNESSKHNVPPGSESHFKITVVSSSFEGKSLIQRHRMVNSVLSDDLNGGIHALSINAKTPDQWTLDPSVHPTPNCMGGGHK
eukprot:gene6270-12700_t